MTLLLAPSITLPAVRSSWLTIVAILPIVAIVGPPSPVGASIQRVSPLLVMVAIRLTSLLSSCTPLTVIHPTAFLF